MLSPLSKTTNPEHTIQLTLIKDLDSIKVNDLLINKTIPVILYNKVLTFRETDIKFELHRDLLKLMNNRNYNVDLRKLLDKKFMYDFGKEMHFDEKT